MEKEAFKFSGSGAENYDRYLGPVLFEPYAAAVTAAIKSPEKVDAVLEIACGTGRVTRHLRARFKPPVRLTASDFSADMLEVAERKLHDPSIEYRVEDAQHLSFDDNSFDVVVCQFGLMFLPDKQKGLREAFRVLKPGGIFICSTWDKTDTMPLLKWMFNDNMLPGFKDSNAERLLLPFSLHDPAVPAAWMKEAGFNHVVTERVVLRSGAASPGDITSGFFSKHSIGQEVLAADKDKFEKMAREMEDGINRLFGNPAISALAAFFITGEK